MHCEWTRAGLSVSTDKGRLNIELIHTLLSKTHWAADIPRAVVERSVANSINFGLYDAAASLIGYGRVVTDRATFAYITDVVIVPERRHQGLGSWLIGCMLAHPELQDLRRWQLTSRNASGFYERFGFSVPPEPLVGLAKINPTVYSRRRSHSPRGQDIASP